MLPNPRGSGDPAASISPPPPPPKTGPGPPLPPHPNQQTIKSSPIDPSRRYSQPPPPPIAASHPGHSSQHQPSNLPVQQRNQHAQYPVSQDIQAQLPPEGWLPPSLADKSKQHLQTLLSTPALLGAVLHAPSTAHPSLAASMQPIERLVAANTALATDLLSHETNLVSRRDHAQQHMLSVRALEQQWRKKQTELEARLEAFGPRVLHQRLAQGITEQDSVCRGLEESFLEREGLATEREVADWIRRTREARKVAGLRRERKRRWDEGRVGGWR